MFVVRFKTVEGRTPSTMWRAFAFEYFRKDCMVTALNEDYNCRDG